MSDGSESKITRQVFVSLKYFSEKMEERTFKIKKDKYKRKVKEKSKKKMGVLKELKVVGEELNGIQDKSLQVFCYDRKYTGKNYRKEKLVNIR